MTVEQIQATVQAIPIIKNWEAIELMAFYGVRNICPLCGGWKKWGFVCDDCRERYGERGAALVMAEVGRKKVGIDERYLWPWFIGKNLSAIWGKRNGHGQKKLKKNPVPIDDPLASEEQTVKIQVLEEKIPETIWEVQAVEVEAPVLQKVEVVKETSAPEETVFLPDRQVEIMLGMKIWHNIAAAMVCGETKNRWVCAVCREPKDFKQWMCYGCYKKYNEVGVIALKTYLATQNPRFNVFPEGSYIPDAKEEDAIMAIVSNLLDSDLSKHLSSHSGGVAKTLKTLKGVNEKIPTLILAKIAREALNRKAVKVHGKQNPLSEKSESAESILVFSGMKNLKEERNIARAFLAFLSDAYYYWNIKEKAGGGKPTKEKFAKKVGYNIASWYSLKYPEKYPGKSGISVKKAEEIAVALNTTLEEALTIGQAFLDKANVF